jgi:hypothetical protein
MEKSAILNFPFYRTVCSPATLLSRPGAAALPTHHSRLFFLGEVSLEKKSVRFEEKMSYLRTG